MKIISTLYFHLFVFIIIRWAERDENMTKVAEYFEDDEKFVAKNTLITELVKFVQNSTSQGMGTIILYGYYFFGCGRFSKG